MHAGGMHVAFPAGLAMAAVMATRCGFGPLRSRGADRRDASNLLHQRWSMAG